MSCSRSPPGLLSKDLELYLSEENTAVCLDLDISSCWQFWLPWGSYYLIQEVLSIALCLRFLSYQLSCSNCLEVLVVFFCSDCLEVLVVLFCSDCLDVLVVLFCSDCLEVLVITCSDCLEVLVILFCSDSLEVLIILTCSDCLEVHVILICSDCLEVLVILKDKSKVWGDFWHDFC